MRKKTTKEIANIGIIDLSELILDTELIQLSILIKSMSDKLQKEVNKAIEASKIDYLKDYNQRWESGNDFSEFGFKRRELKWSDQGVDIDTLFLDVTIKDKNISYCVAVCYVDKEDEYLEYVAYIEVDLSAYNNEIKKLVVKAMIDKFF